MVTSLPGHWLRRVDRDHDSAGSSAAALSSVEHRRRYGWRQRMLVAVTSGLVVLGMAPASEAFARPQAQQQPSAEQQGPAPRLDPGDPNGAWAGYSLEGLNNRGPQQPPWPDLNGTKAGSVEGMDVSGHQGRVDWRKAWNNGARFVWIKSTEGTTFRSRDFSHQYQGASAVGMARGAYHFALPNRSSGAVQANFFVDNGGGWSKDGKSLPGALDIEHNPYGAACYGLSPAQMVQWISDFSSTYKKRTGREPAIYTTTKWWNACTGSSSKFAANHPLWIARYNSYIGALPAGWRQHTVWQYNNSGVFPGDQNRFNGNADQLARFARGGTPTHQPLDDDSDSTGTPAPPDVDQGEGGEPDPLSEWLNETPGSNRW